MDPQTPIRHHGQLPLVVEVFGDDPAAVEEILGRDADMLLGIVTGTAGRRAVVSIDEIQEGSWIYLAVELDDDTREDLLDAARLRSLLDDHTRPVWSLVSTDFAGVQVQPEQRPIPRHVWLPVSSS